MTSTLALGAAVMLAHAITAGAQTVGSTTMPPPGERPETAIGLAWGRGPLHHGEGLQPGSRGVLTLDISRVTGSRGFFVDVSQWTRPRASYATQYRSSDTVAAGLRLRGHGRLRPYFDAGAVVADHRFGSRSVTTVGGVVGTGAELGQGRFYLRGGVRLMLMTELYG